MIRQETWPIHAQTKEGAGFAGAISRDEAKGDSHSKAGQQEESSTLLGTWYQGKQISTGRERVLRLRLSKEAVLSLVGQAGV